MFVNELEISLEVMNEFSGLVACEREMGRGRRVGGPSQNRVRPNFDESLEGVVGDEVFITEHLHGGGAGVVAAVKPPLDTAAIVGDTRAQADRRFHNV